MTGGGTNLAVLLKKPAAADERREDAAQGTNVDAGAEEETFTVERILDYTLWNKQEYDDPSQWAHLGGPYEIRFKVKWKGYDDPDEDTWEPRENFDYWDADYDAQIEAIRASHPDKPTVAEIRAEAKSKNRAWRKGKKKRAAAAEQSGVKGAAKDKGKGKGKEKEKVEGVKKVVKKEVKPSAKGKWKTSNPSRAESVASTSTSVAAGPSAPKPRQTRNSAADGAIDQKALEEFLACNAPRDMRKLRFTPPPERDEHGNIIYPNSSEPSNSPASNSARLLAADQSTTSDALGFADDDDEDVEMADSGTGAAGVQLQSASHVKSQVNGLGFADSEDEDEDDEGAYFPPLVPRQPSQTFSLELRSHQPTPQPPQPRPSAMGFAGSSEDEDEPMPMQDAAVVAAVAAAAADAVPISAGVSGAGSERELSVAKGGFADSEDEDEDEDERPAAPTAAPTPVANGFASSDEEREEVVAGPSGQEGTAADAAKQRDVAATTPSAAAVPSAAADAVEQGVVAATAPPAAVPSAAADAVEQGVVAATAPPAAVPSAAADAVEQGVVAATAPPAAVPSAAASRASGAAASEPQGYTDASSEEDISLAALSPLPQPERSRETSMQPPKKRASSASHQPPPPARPHKRPSQDDVRPVSSTKPTKVVKVVKAGVQQDARTVKGKERSPEETRRPAAPKRPSLDAHPAKKRKKLFIVDDEVSEVDGDTEMSPSSTQTQAQQLKKLKIPKIGQKRLADPAAPAPPPTTGSASKRVAQSPSLSNETPSLGSSAQARKVHDPFNQGVVRTISSNGYIRLNGDVLRQKKLSATLTRGESVRYPPGVESEVDKIRFLWSIRPGGDALRGILDFDDAMHLHGQAREVYISEPPDEAMAGRDKRARRHLTDYQALQLVLSSIEGVRQADSPRNSVKAVFVHATELGQVGKFAGAHHQLETFFRRKEDVMFFAFGEGDDRKRAMQTFWRPHTAFTFTPTAFKRNPARISELVIKSQNAFSTTGLRSQYAWVPLQYLLPGGAFGPVPPPVDEGESPKWVQTETFDSDEARIKLKADLYSLVLQGQLPLATVGARSPTSHKSLIFPDRCDRADYHSKETSLIAKVYPPDLCALDLTGLQKVVCMWRTEYPQIRRWLIIATPDELEKCAELAGIYLCPLEHAEQALSC